MTRPRSWLDFHFSSRCVCVCIGNQSKSARYFKENNIPPFTFTKPHTKLEETTEYERDRQRDKQSDRNTGRQTDRARLTDRNTEREREREREREAGLRERDRD